MLACKHRRRTWPTPKSFYKIVDVLDWMERRRALWFWEEPDRWIVDMLDWMERNPRG